MNLIYSVIVERMKKTVSLKNDSALARRLNITPQALSNFKKKGTIPADIVLQFAELFKVSVDFLLTGEGEPFRSERRLTRIPEGTEPPELSKTLMTSEDLSRASDKEIIEIMAWLKEHPHDKALVAKLIKGKKITKEALEGLGVTGLIAEGEA